VKPQQVLAFVRKSYKLSRVRPSTTHPHGPRSGIETMKPALLRLFALLALAACAAPQTPAPVAAPAGAPADAQPWMVAGGAAPTDTAFYPAWSRSATLYEVNVRQFTPEGTLAALLPHLPRLRAMGVDILWLMPVQPIGVQNRKGGLGSYYSIRDYTAINPEHGTEADFRRFVDAAHAQGMRVILDWVANHTAHDHAWTREHRDWYTLRPDGSISFPLDQNGKETDWTDVADLNYGSAPMRRAMIDEMRWWLERMNIDGFRMDVAWGIPYDFWAEAHRELTAARPDIFLLAEAEDHRLHQWFHASYAWELHHLMNEIAQGKKPAAELDHMLAKQDSLYGRGAYRMMFTSNHDENSWQGTEFERMGANHLPSFVLSATLQNSFPLLYTGQEASLNKRLRFFEKDTVDWSGPSLAPFYTAMFDLKHRNPALANGPWGGPQTPLRTNGGDRVYAFTRTKGANTVLVAVNFGDAPVSAAYQGLAQPEAWTSPPTATASSSASLERSFACVAGGAEFGRAPRPRVFRSSRTGGWRWRRADARLAPAVDAGGAGGVRSPGAAGGWPRAGGRVHARLPGQRLGGARPPGERRRSPRDAGGALSRG
jgi:alpha-amylase